MFKNRRMRILLLMPLDLYKSWPFPNDFTRFLFPAPAVTYPLLSALYPNADFTILDGLVEKISTKSFIKFISCFDIVCINCPASEVALNVEINIKFIKEINPSVIIIMGGHHATFYSKDWIKKGVDFVVRGEAEISFPNLLNAIIKGGGFNDIKGVTYNINYDKPTANRQNKFDNVSQDEIIYNPDQEFIDNLDYSPLPKWENMNLNNYDLGLSGGGLTATLETSRGCGNKCNFCCAGPMWKNVQRFKSAERVIHEFGYLFKMGIRQVLIADDNFGANIRRDSTIFENIIKENINLKLVSFLRADVIAKNQDFIELAIRAGLKGVLVGFESLEVSDLRIFNKNYSREIIDKYKKIYNLFRKNDVLVMGLFLEGFPGQSYSNHSYKYANNICDIAAFSHFRPTVGIEGYSVLSKIEGLKIKDMFYHDRYIPTFSLLNKILKEHTVLGHLKSLFSITKVFRMALHNDIKRVFLLRVYINLIKSVFLEININKVRGFIYSIFPGVDPDRRQELLNKIYLRKKYLQDIR